MGTALSHWKPNQFCRELTHSKGTKSWVESILWFLIPPTRSAWWLVFCSDKNVFTRFAIRESTLHISSKSLLATGQCSDSKLSVVEEKKKHKKDAIGIFRWTRNHIITTCIHFHASTAWEAQQAFVDNCTSETTCKVTPEVPTYFVIELVANIYLWMPLLPVCLDYYC